MAQASIHKTVFPHDAHLIRDKVAELFDVQGVSHWWTSRSRRRNLVEPRMALMYLLRYYCRLGVTEVALYVGRDHSTVVHGCQTVEDLRRQVRGQKSFIAKLQQLERWAEIYTGGAMLDAEDHYPKHLRPKNWPKDTRDESLGYI